MDFEFDFENVIKDFNTFNNFTEYDETEWDYLDDDEFYERTKDWNIPYDAELTCCCDIEWTEDGAEIIEENIEEEDEEEEEDDEE